MVPFIFGLLIIVIIGLGGLGVSNWGRKRLAELKNKEDDSYSSRVTEAREAATAAQFFGRIGAGVGVLAGAALIFFGSMLVINGQGEAKVVTNLDGSVASTLDGPNTIVKAPWQNTVNFDTFSQELLYAGDSNGTPSYSGGQVNGQEVTVSVGGLNGGSTQANVDISITYSVDGGEVADIYKKYRTQERFTKQVVEKTILAITRTAPSEYTAIEFRGAKKDEVGQLILDRANDKLDSKGVTVDLVNIQAPRFPENVEKALNDVESANQAAAKAEAEQRTAEVEAETARIKAQGEADAIAIRNSQAPNDAVLRQLQIEAYKKGTIYVVPEGSTPFVTIK